LEEARDVGRGLGIKLWVIVQELGQLRKLYGQDGISAWLENTGIQHFFGIKGLETAKRLVDTLGETMVDVSSVSLNQYEWPPKKHDPSLPKSKNILSLRSMRLFSWEKRIKSFYPNIISL
jgi:type IV secretory pathway TraG/TraD family ATPase VirD4